MTKKLLEIIKLDNLRPLSIEESVYLVQTYYLSKEKLSLKRDRIIEARKSGDISLVEAGILLNENKHEYVKTVTDLRAKIRLSFDNWPEIINSNSLDVRMVISSPFSRAKKLLSRWFKRSK
jgi:CRISPR/Cas system CMR subunit Cmr6 (Cas7 group RAMP superfamily)